MFGKKFSKAQGTVVAILLILNVVLAPRAFAATNYKILHRFNGTGGSLPAASLIFDSAGNLYGTTFGGGAHDYGTVFQLNQNSNGSYTENVLYSFNNDGNDGVRPFGSLIFDPQGNLFGTTSLGGAHQAGTVFQLTPNGDGTWKESVLHSFNPDTKDGGQPHAGLIFDSAGNLYGTTFSGGTDNLGSVFSLSPNGDGSWTEKVLHSFTFFGKDGYQPYSVLIFDSTGTLYGTTESGGAHNYGAVFELQPNGDGTWKENLLHSFKARGKGGNLPYAGLIFDSAGNLYGTTSAGGTHHNGTVFQLKPNGDGTWQEAVLHSFNGQDGFPSLAGLTFDPAGNLYGTTLQGGAYGYGTVFTLKSTLKGRWKITVLHSFRNRPGEYSAASVIFDGHGNMYGTTEGNGGNNYGEVFKITP